MILIFVEFMSLCIFISMALGGRLCYDPWSFPSLSLYVSGLMQARLHTLEAAGISSLSESMFMI